eukprot:353336-Chlamydomonas_euryale.AAC.9
MCNNAIVTWPLVINTTAPTLNSEPAALTAGTGRCLHSGRKLLRWHGSACHSCHTLGGHSSLQRSVPRSW